jgi:hypothetical protein
MTTLRRPKQRDPRRGSPSRTHQFPPPPYRASLGVGAEEELYDHPDKAKATKGATKDKEDEGVGSTKSMRVVGEKQKVVGAGIDTEF